MARPLRGGEGGGGGGWGIEPRLYEKNFFFKLQKKIQKNTLKALVALPLKKNHFYFFAASLRRRLKKVHLKYFIT